MKKLGCLLLAALLLSGCAQKATMQESVEETQAVTEPAAPTGEYLLQQQIYYDENERQVVNMEVTFNDSMLPVSVFLDSGADVTYTPSYNEDGSFAGFTISRMLYGEETVSTALVNDRGDITEKTAEGKTTHIAYGYDTAGRIIKKETSANGNLSSVKTWSYDSYGNLTGASSTDATGGYTLVYENTYDGNLLTAVHCKFEGGETEHTESLTYDAKCRLTQKELFSGDETTTTVYTYNEQGLTATEISLLNGQEYSRTEYSYNEMGLLAEKRTYENGAFTGRITYTWTTDPVEITAAQRNVLKQLGVIL